MRGKHWSAKLLAQQMPVPTTFLPRTEACYYSPLLYSYSERP